MNKPIREITIANGIMVHFLDKSRRYFGDFHHVRIDIRCTVPILADNFNDNSLYTEAKSLFGESIIHVRKVEQMGIPGSKLITTKESLIVNFIEHTLPYFTVPSFPMKLVMAEMAKRKKNRLFPAANLINLHG